MRRDYLASGQQLTNKLAAYSKGKKVYTTIPNPDKNNKKERFIKLPYNIALHVK